MMGTMPAPAGGHPGMQQYTPQDLDRIRQKWAALRKQGFDESTSPELANLTRFLRAVQAQQQQLQAQQQMQHAQGSPGLQRVPQQQQRPAMPPNGMAQVNGRGPVPQQHNQMPQTPTQNAGSPQQRAGEGEAAGAPGARMQNASFSAEQLSLLHNQIKAFKHICRHTAPPPALLQAILGPLQALKAQVQAAQAPTPDVKAEPGALVRAASQSGYEKFTSPWAKLESTIGFLEHALREKRVLIPSITPPGLDLEQLHEERERVIHARINARKMELENLASNLASQDLKSENGGELDDKMKIKALIELKSINLLNKQRNLRLEYLRDTVHSESLAFNTNRAAYRRMKKQSLNEARVTEQLEKAMRQEKQRKEKEKHHTHLERILNRGRKLKDENYEWRSRKHRIGQEILNRHRHIEKEEQKRMERTAKQRLQALKANDEEAYLKLLDEAKDTRITHLLRQTDSFLDSLAASVRQQQRDAIRTYGRHDNYIEEESEDEEEDRGKVDYYAVAHRIQETITEQPSILIGGKLKDYQIKGLQWMVSLYNNSLNGILADEMGLGKTIQTLSLITFLIEKKKQNGPFLVIVPLSTLTNWNLEFDKWAPSIAKIVYKGTPNMRKQFQQQIRSGHFQVLLTTYEFIIKDRPVLSKVKWTYMIVDEGHRMKNSQSKLSFNLTTYYNCRYRLILTGTPLQNNLPELWNLLNFVLPTIFKSVKSFDEWFNTPFANTGTSDKMELTEEESLLVIRRLHKVLRPFLLRRLKKDVESELPDKREEVIKCKFSALQAKLYSQMVNDGMLFVQDDSANAKAGGKTSIKGLSNVIMQLRKICNHPFVFEEIENSINPSKTNNDNLWRTAGKFELLDRLLPKFFATKHRVLMFFQMTQIMNIMEDFLHLRGYKYLRLDGATKADDRSALLKLFNAPGSEYFIFLLSTRAGGLGLNLQTADTVIIYDSDWNPHQDLQAQDRAHRIGQKNEVRILRLITSNSVEEKILERAQYKLDIDGKVIQAGKFDNKSTNEERDALLRTLLEADKDVMNQDEEMDDEELNEVCARSDEELQMFRRIDAERNKDPTYGSAGRLPRLYSESELPDVYVRENIPEVEEIVPQGRGARERASIRYDDGLTEEQWLDAIDEGEDVEELVKQKRERDERRAQTKAKKNVPPKEASPLPPSSPIPETPPAKRKRGRKPVSEKKKEKELPEEPKRKRPRAGGKGSDVLSPHSRQQHQQLFDAVYNAVKDLKDTEADRCHSEHFIVLPSKKYYPDYYQFIASPISFDMIRKRIDKAQYNSVDDFKADFMLMFANARQYNEPGSPVYIDAEKMEAEFSAMLREQMEALGITNTTRPSSRGDSGSVAQSSVGTPSATPMIKIKLGGKRTNGSSVNRGSATPYDSEQSADDSD